MVLKINLIITAIIFFIIFVGCYKKYRDEKYHFNNGVCPKCGKHLEYKGDVTGERQYQCPGCKYTTYIDWLKA